MGETFTHPTSVFSCHHMLIERLRNWWIELSCNPFSAFHLPSFSPTHTTVCFAPVCFPSLKRLPWQPIVLPGSQHIPRAHVQGRLDTHSHNTHSLSDSRLEIDCALSLLHKTVFTPASVDEAARFEIPAKSRSLAAATLCNVLSAYSIHFFITVLGFCVASMLSGNRGMTLCGIWHDKKR